MARILVDTSAVYALLDRGDGAHAAARTDKTSSYTDATSFAVMERLGIDSAFAFDPHFRQYGFRLLGPAAAGGA